MFQALTADEADELRAMLIEARINVSEKAHALRYALRDKPWSGDKRQAFRLADGMTRISGDITAVLWQLKRDVSG